MTKPALGEYMNEVLCLRYGSVAEACRVHDIKYEALKKAIQRGSFSRALLEKLFPDITTDELLEKYDFILSKRQRLTNSRLARLVHVGHLTNLIDDKDILLIRENKMVAEKIAELIKLKCEQIRQALS